MTWEEEATLPELYQPALFKKDVPMVCPRHTGNIMANLRLSRYLNLYTSCHFEDGFRRQRKDNRDDMSGYAIFNTTLIAQKFLKGYEGLELRASVYNLFDKDYSSPAGNHELPQDIPRPGGISWWRRSTNLKSRVQGFEGPREKHKKRVRGSKCSSESK